MSCTARERVMKSWLDDATKFHVDEETIDNLVHEVFTCDRIMCILKVERLYVFSI